MKKLITVILLVLTVVGNAQNFQVNTIIDAVDANPGNGICDDGSGNCPLRAAIQESNALGGAHTITLPAGTITLSVAGINEDACATGDLDVTSNITINGVSPSVTIIDIDSIDRGFHILSTGQLTISNTTIKNGNTLKDHGGGFLNQGVLSINYCHVTENTSTLPVGATYSGGFGGGIANFGDLTIENSTLFLNEAIGGRGTNGQNGGGGGGSTPGFGGAIYNNLNGLITLKNSTISNNNAVGGKYSAGSTSGGNFTFAGKRGAGLLGGNGGAAGGGAGGNGGDFSGGGGGGSSGSFGGTGGMGGYGAGGGGCGARSGSGTSPGSGGLNGFGGGQGSNPCCTSGGGGGGAAGFGGGIFNNGGTITSINSSIAFNSAYGGQGQSLNSIGGYARGGTPGQGLGGGIFNRAGTVDLSNTLIASNTNYNDILNSNTAGITSNEELYGTFTSTNGHNLIFNIGSGVLAGNTTGNIIGQDPLISPLANNGGSTHTIKIGYCPTSPAIDAGLDAVAPVLDQRDFPRLNNYGGANIVDIGAFESTDSLLFSEETLSACDSLLWSVNGNTYTQSGIYYDSLQSSNGCDSVVTLNLTITQGPTCDSLGVNNCNTVYVSDTLNTNVSDVQYQNISPQTYLAILDTFPQFSNPNCDSIVSTYRQFIYNPNYCTDTILTYDTVFNQIYDTTTAYDTLITYDTLTTYDTVFNQIYDTTIVFDTLNISVIDTSYISISVSDTLYIDITVTGMTSMDNTITVYPNPANDVVIIDNGNYSIMNNYNLRIFNSLSQQVFFSQINTQQFQIPVSTLGAVGTYIIQIFDSANNIVKTKYLILN